jgi:AraC-like DNA-binding protein/quercetin dioxygenase-like cupin family protein
MGHSEPRLFHQSFLPVSGNERAFVWKYSQAIGGRRPRHFHIEPELNLVVRGSATFAIGSSVAAVSQGDLLAFPPGQDHALLTASPDFYLYAVGLEPAYAAEVLGQERAAGIPLHVALSAEEFCVILDRAATIVDRRRAHSLAAELWEQSYWVGLRGVPRNRRATHVLTRRTLQLLSRAPELDLDALARYVRAHPSEVSRHFHRDMGITLSRYRVRLRLLHFIRQVDTGERDLMASASIAGFGSYSQAHRSFQAELGCGPRQFFSEGLREQMQATYSTI